MTTLDPADAVDLAPHRALQDQVRAIAVAKAAEDDIITAAEAAEGKEETLKMCTDMMAVYMCVKCDTPYCGGKVECADEMKVDKDKMVCHDCRWKEAQEAGGGKCLIRVYLTTCYPYVGSRLLQTRTLHSHATILQCAINVRSNTPPTRTISMSSQRVRSFDAVPHSSFNPQSFNPQSSPPTSHFNTSQLLTCILPQLSPPIP